MGKALLRVACHRHAPIQVHTPTRHRHAARALPAASCPRGRQPATPLPKGRRGIGIQHSTTFFEWRCIRTCRRRRLGLPLLPTTPTPIHIPRRRHYAVPMSKPKISHCCGARHGHGHRVRRHDARKAEASERGPLLAPSRNPKRIFLHAWYLRLARPARPHAHGITSPMHTRPPRRPLHGGRAHARRGEARARGAASNRMWSADKRGSSRRTVSLVRKRLRFTLSRPRPPPLAPQKARAQPRPPGHSPWQAPRHQRTCTCLWPKPRGKKKEAWTCANGPAKSSSPPPPPSPPPPVEHDGATPTSPSTAPSFNLPSLVRRLVCFSRRELPPWGFPSLCTFLLEAHAPSSALPSHTTPRNLPRTCHLGRGKEACGGARRFDNAPSPRRSSHRKAILPHTRAPTRFPSTTHPPREHVPLRMHVHTRTQRPGADHAWPGTHLLLFCVCPPPPAARGKGASFPLSSHPPTSSPLPPNPTSSHHPPTHHPLHTDGSQTKPTHQL